MKKSEQKNTEPKRIGKVTHIMADGTIRDSVKGYLDEPGVELPDIAKRIIRQMILAPSKKDSQ